MRIVAFAAVAALSPAAPALAQVSTPCAALPLAGVAPSTNTVTEPAYCDAVGLAAPAWQGSGYVIPGALGGGRLSYVDRFQGECQQVLGGAGTGRYKRPTICPPGRQKVDVGGVWMCRSQAAASTTMPRADCYANHPISAGRTSADVFLPRPGSSQGVTRIMLQGANVGWTDVVLTPATPGAPAPEITVARGLVDSNCMAPRCLRVVVTTTTRTTPGSHTLTLGWPTGGAAAVVNLTAVDPPPPRRSGRNGPPRTCGSNPNC